ncbi:MAG TPA: hypothetical protein DET40_19215 [Lentisphaeria bacterium]|nr:MAG: hypothetical protein A2X45_18045 [Lentisphaerae bacterium GWF2_50_93]HCE45678.1 hypothetical protein [Lentisphaeria bacterium]
MKQEIYSCLEKYLLSPLGKLAFRDVSKYKVPVIGRFGNHSGGMPGNRLLLNNQPAWFVKFIKKGSGNER